MSASSGAYNGTFNYQPAAATAPQSSGGQGAYSNQWGQPGQATHQPQANHQPQHHHQQQQPVAKTSSYDYSKYAASLDTPAAPQSSGGYDMGSQAPQQQQPAPEVRREEPKPQAKPKEAAKVCLSSYELLAGLCCRPGAWKVSVGSTVWPGAHGRGRRVNPPPTPFLVSLNVPPVQPAPKKQDDKKESKSSSGWFSWLPLGKKKEGQAHLGDKRTIYFDKVCVCVCVRARVCVVCNF